MSGPLLEWDCVARPFPGEAVCGDRALAAVAGRRAVAVAVDGLGHGPEAAVAAKRAVDTVRDTRHEEIADVAERCHAALHDTRGAALSLAEIDADAGTLTWLGVGNVEGRLVRAGEVARAGSESLMLLTGVVGYDLPPLRAATLAIGRGDLLLFATDGVDPGFADSLRASGSCGDIARRLVEQHGRPTDDALVLAVRYLGGQS